MSTPHLHDQGERVSVQQRSAQAYRMMNDLAAISRLCQARLHQLDDDELQNPEAQQEEATLWDLTQRMGQVHHDLASLAPPTPNNPPSPTIQEAPRV